MVIGLQLAGVEDKAADFDIITAKNKNPREIELVILKNRQAKSGAAIKYYYYPMFNFYFEDPNGLKDRTQPPKTSGEKKAAAKSRAADLENLNRLFDACQENGRATLDKMTKYKGGEKLTRAALIKQFEQFPDDFIVSGHLVFRAITPDNFEI